jgi:hypothetical protein
MDDRRSCYNGREMGFLKKILPLLFLIITFNQSICKLLFTKKVTTLA